MINKRDRFFIAGTDTGVGKSLVSSALLCAAVKLNYSTLGLKPVAAGGHETPLGFRNEDAELLMEHSTVKLPYEQVNPICLKEAIAPHIAAEREGRQLRVERVAGYTRGALMSRAKLVIVEGAGGWRVPLNRSESMADMAKALNLPVILVVGIKLGCLNHALLTAQAMAQDGVRIAGWVATQLEQEMPAYKENINTLQLLLPFPLLLELPFFTNCNTELVANTIDIQKVLELSAF